MDRVDIGLGRTHVRPQGALRPQTGLDFIAIDFETANARRSSACAVGWAMVAGGRVVDSGSLLINPEAEFSRYNTAITGLDADSVAAAPTFPELWPQLAAVLAGQTVVAHMATFDLTVLRQSVARYELEGIGMRASCSWRLAKLSWPELPSFGLGYLASRLGIKFEHHDAGHDAAACAQVVLHAQRDHGAGSLRALLEHYGLPLGDLHSASFKGLTAASPSLHSRAGDETADPDHPLFGKCLSFTGTMFSMTRPEAVERLAVVGADFRPNPSKHVDFLVVGDADFALFADGYQTGKLKKAIDIKQDGDDIEVISERDFLALLG